MIRPIWLALAMGGPAFAGGAGDLDLGLYTGALLPGPNHELYEATVAPHRQLSPGPTLGGRVGYRPVKVFGVEGETHGAFSGTEGGTSALLYAFRLHGMGLLPVDLPADIEPFALAGIGDIGVSSSADDAVGNDLDVAAHTGLGARLPLNERLLLRADLRYLFTAKHTVVKSPGGHTELLVGLNYRIPGASDRDGDGISDADDRCPTEAETVNEYKDADGCPDTLARMKVEVLDQDGAPVPGVAILVDGAEVGRTEADGKAPIKRLMPDTQVSVVGSHPHMDDSEPLAVSLVEGPNPQTLRMVWHPGRVRIVAKSADGPVRDAKASFRGTSPAKGGPIEGGDAVFHLAPGSWTILVEAESLGTERRELEIAADQLSTVVVEVDLAPAKVEVTREEVKILEKILFATDSAQIDGSSTALLNEVANTLVANPHIKRVEVQGHSDSTGPDAYNLQLSQKRMESVVAWLVGKGVEKSRLIAKGYGETVPIADNETEEGRAKNRRVQFVILDQEL